MNSLTANSIFIKIVLPIAIITLLAYLVCWTGVFRLAVFPYPHDIFFDGIKTFKSDSDPLLAILTTLRRLFISFFISFFVGLFMALLFNSLKILEDIFALPIDVIRSIPVITLFPLFITLFGFTEASYLAVPIVSTSVIMYIYIAFGLQSISSVKHNLMRKWGSNKFQQIRHLYLPTIAPHLFTSIKICISLQLILVLVAEMFLGADDGLGTLIYDYQEILEYEEMYFFIILSGILGWLINRFFEYSEHKIIFWK